MTRRGNHHLAVIIWPYDTQSEQMVTSRGNEEGPDVDVPEEIASVVRAGARAHREVPGSVAVGGSACALYCHHRVSVDIDSVLRDLSARFDAVRDHLFEVPSWTEARVKKPVLILGSLDGIPVGYRQLRRPTPLETREIELPNGSLTVPTVDEMLRVKAFLLYDRNYTRDFVDFAELSCLQPTGRVVDALGSLDEKFGWESWEAVSNRCQEVGRSLSLRVLGGGAS